MLFDDFYAKFKNPKLEYQRSVQEIYFSLYFRFFRRNLRPIFGVEKFHQKVKRLTNGFWRFFPQFQDHDISSGYESSAWVTSFSVDLRHIMQKLRSKIADQKFHKKVKGLTQGFWRFFHQFQNLEISSKYETLAQIICFSFYLKHFSLKLRSKIGLEKFHEKVKG